MSKAAKTSHPLLRAGFAIAAIGTIAISANILISSLGIGHKGLDFTQNRVHTLSDGTRSILKELGAPVKIRYYATRNSDYMPANMKLHMKRVDEVLRDYERISGGKLRVENLDPQPDTDAEDSAQLDGISGQKINDQNLFFGLAISCVDRTAIIPFLDPGQETMLEYDLSRAISEVSRPDKPVIGMMSALPIQGSPGMMPGQGTSPWVIYQQLKQSYDIRDVPMTSDKIDADIDVLLVVHPAQITPAAEFAIDQYVLGGGTVIACVDPYSAAAEFTASGGNPMMGGRGGVPTSSTLPTLFQAWGLTLNPQVLADPAFANPNAGPIGASLPIFTEKAMPQKDNVVTKNLRNLQLYLPGGFTKTGGSGVSIETLVKSSNLAGFVDPIKASRRDPSLATSIRPTGQTYDVVLHLSGNFKSAFPGGKPGETPPSPEEPGKDGAEAKKEGEKKPDSLLTATKPGNVFLIADVDAFYDQVAYQIQNLGGNRSVVMGPANDNSTLLMNLVDQAASSPYLIGARSRTATARPFDKIKEMEAEFTKNAGKREDDFNKTKQDVREKINDLQAKKTNSKDIYLSPEQEDQIHTLLKAETDINKQIRDLQKDLQRDKDRLAGTITLGNILTMPVVVAFIGLCVILKRRASSRAR